MNYINIISYQTVPTTVKNHNKQTLYLVPVKESTICSFAKVGPQVQNNVHVVENGCQIAQFFLAHPFL